MTYQLFIPSPVGKKIGRLQHGERERVDEVLLALADEPRPRGSRKLSGRDEYRVRVGNYRVVYAVDDETRLVEVLKVAHRREVYRKR